MSDMFLEMYLVVAIVLAVGTLFYVFVMGLALLVDTRSYPMRREARSLARVIIASPFVIALWPLSAVVGLVAFFWWLFLTAYGPE